MSAVKIRASVSKWLLSAGNALGLFPGLKRCPLIYNPLRKLLVFIVGGGLPAREIVSGPLRGYKMVLGLGDRNAYLVNTYEPITVELAQRLCQPGMQILDMGAHVGYFSLLFSVLVGPAGQVYTLEPNPENLKKIKSMIEINGLQNIRVFPFAASDQTGDVQFITENTGSMGHITTLPAESRDAVVTVRAVRMDDLAFDHGVDRIDLIKMDVEGAELKALAGMSGLIRRCHPTIICEWHPAVAGPNYRTAFEGLGYHCEALEAASATEPFHVLARPTARVQA
jgi:FkbM family methyltransferase